MYIPTKNEINEIGFIDSDNLGLYTINLSNYRYLHWSEEKNQFILGHYDEIQRFYPQSKEDIMTIIRIFTNPK